MKKAITAILLSILFVIGLLTGCASSGKSAENKSLEQQINNQELEVGDQAPDFRLPDHKGGYVRLSDFRDKYNVVLAFYPAAFTPV